MFANYWLTKRDLITFHCTKVPLFTYDFLIIFNNTNKNYLLEDTCHTQSSLIFLLLHSLPLLEVTTVTSLVCLVITSAMFIHIYVYIQIQFCFFHINEITSSYCFSTCFFVLNNMSCKLFNVSEYRSTTHWNGSWNEILRYVYFPQCIMCSMPWQVNIYSSFKKHHFHETFIVFFLFSTYVSASASPFNLSSMKSKNC